ncbi:hypothetical protein ACW9YQ_04740 [Paraburkholderia strydomiana]|uniref:hypothetical protein n=1 Tax=Paraburkholderia strydomiana TaxID=1245417 RepID=UPI00195C6686|nr:hypothetical protein [Paraburkholderia strydomiana]MDR7009769.1 hypothetical protein [Paraburkholderia strydomiana]
MNYRPIVAVVLFLLVASFIKPAFAQDQWVRVGNAAGQTASADGPAVILVDMGNCRFSMTIGKRDHVKYNDPDLVLYRANRTLTDHHLPHLKQAEMTSGYDWWFEEPKTMKAQWMGLMCDKISNFKWSSSSTRAEVSPELQDIMDSNSLKCPANFDGKQWVPISSKDGVIFKNIDLSETRGFVIDSRSKTKDQGSRFCFIHGENILIGVSGGGANLRNEKKGSILNVLQSIEFKSDDSPMNQ